MKKTIEVISEMSDKEVKDWLNDFAEKNSVLLSLSKECRDHLAWRGIYWPYKKLSDELE